MYAVVVTGGRGALVVRGVLDIRRGGVGIEIGGVVWRVLGIVVVDAGCLRAGVSAVDLLDDVGGW